MRSQTAFLIMMVYSINAHSIDFADLDVDDRVKNQIAAGFLLDSSIDEFVVNQTNSGEFATVGVGADCDYSIGSTKIQDAIDVGEKEIRIAMNDNYDVGLVIHDKSLILRGGYEDCTAAKNGVQSSKTELGHLSTTPVIKITGDAQRNTVVLDELLLTGGNRGVYTENADVQIAITNTWVLSNKSITGAGIKISGGNTDVSLQSALISLNEATQGGGGIACSGADTEERSIVMDDQSGIYGNSVTDFQDLVSVYFGYHGGGVNLAGCDFLNYSGANGLSDLRGIAGNTATGDGAGIFAFGGSLVTLFGHQVCLNNKCSGNDTAAVTVKDNVANASVPTGTNGGGIYVQGENTALHIYAGLVSGNTANSSGGGIFVGSGATLESRRLTKKCWDQFYCNHFVGNKANLGGMLSVLAASANMTHAVIENNRADNGTAIFLNSGAAASINGSILHHNANKQTDGFDDKSLVYLANEDSEITVFHSTIADNNVVDSIFNITGDASAGSRLVSSIVHNNNANAVNILNPTPGPLSVECSMLHEDDSISTQSFSVVVAEPGFVDRSNRNYHIKPINSLAVDYCFANNSDHPDIDFEERGWDNPAVSNNHGPFDIGADESTDSVFKNGFE